MDFKKIELIFLTVFLSIDIFLFFTILQTPSLSTDSTSDNENNIRTEMKSDNISLPKLTDEGMSGYYLASQVKDNLNTKMANLTNQRVSYNQATHLLSSRLNEPIKVTNREKLISELEEFKGNPHNILFGNDYRYSKEFSSTNDVIFLQITKFGPIVGQEGQLHFYIRDGVITGYSQSYQANLVSLREKQDTISPLQAVKYLYMYSELANDSKINWVKLGYTKMTEVKGSVIYLPTWSIGIENKNTKNFQIKRVNAFNGSIISGL